MKKIFISVSILAVILIIILGCSKIIESNNTAEISIDLVFPEESNTIRNQIEAVTIRIYNNDSYDETFNLVIENNVASGSVELEYGIYSFYVEAGYFDNEIFYLLYFGNSDNVDISESSNLVEINLIESVAPTADFSGTPTSGNAPLTVQFTDLSTAGSSPITDWLWVFGDGSTSTSQNPSHTFTSNGDYTVELSVTTLVGIDNEVATNYINVTSNPIGPTADFSGTPTSGNAPLTVQFTDLSTAGSSPITDWLWVFGDGSTSTSQNPSHIYTTGGVYSVALNVTTSIGSDSEAKPNYINVQQGSFINVTSPNGGEDWELGTTETILWTSGNAGNYVKIELFRNNSFYQTIATSTGNDGTYNWNIPSNYIESDYYKIKISSTSNTTIYDYSTNYFTLSSSTPAYVEIGSGITAWGYPFYTSWCKARSQIIYLSNEIGTSGTINSVAVYVTVIPGQVMYNFTIRMKHTSISSYNPGVTNQFDNTGYVFCLNTTLSVTNTGWVLIPLTTPFTYIYPNNLIVDVTYNNSSYSTSGESRYTETGIYRMLHYNSDTGDPLEWTYAIEHNRITNIRLYFQ